MISKASLFERAYQSDPTIDTDRFQNETLLFDENPPSTIDLSSVRQDSSEILFAERIISRIKEAEQRFVMIKHHVS